jgi:hypothetical protein
MGFDLWNNPFTKAVKSGVKYFIRGGVNAVKNSTPVNVIGNTPLGKSLGNYLKQTPVGKAISSIATPRPRRIPKKSTPKQPLYINPAIPKYTLDPHHSLATPKAKKFGKKNKVSNRKSAPTSTQKKQSTPWWQNPFKAASSAFFSTSFGKGTRKLASETVSDIRLVTAQGTALAEGAGTALFDNSNAINNALKVVPQLPYAVRTILTSPEARTKVGQATDIELRKGLAYLDKPLSVGLADYRNFVKQWQADGIARNTGPNESREISGAWQTGNAFANVGIGWLTGKFVSTLKKIGELSELAQTTKGLAGKPKPVIRRALTPPEIAKWRNEGGGVNMNNPSPFRNQKPTARIASIRKAPSHIDPKIKLPEEFQLEGILKKAGIDERKLLEIVKGGRGIVISSEYGPVAVFIHGDEVAFYSNTNQIVGVLTGRDAEVFKNDIINKFKSLVLHVESLPKQKTRTSSKAIKVKNTSSLPLKTPPTSTSTKSAKVSKVGHPPPPEPVANKQNVAHHLDPVIEENHLKNIKLIIKTKHLTPLEKQQAISAVKNGSRTFDPNKNVLTISDGHTEIQLHINRYEVKITNTKPENYLHDAAKPTTPPDTKKGKKQKM